MKCFVYLLQAAIIIISACQSRGNSKSPSIADNKHVQYARGFTIRDFDGYRIISVFNPWQQLHQVELTYVLYQDKEKVPVNLNAATCIQVPVNRVVTTSTTHIAMICALDKQESVVGVSGGKYISDPIIRKKIDAGHIRDIGYEQSQNFEELIGLNPEVVIMYGVSGEISSVLQKLKSLQIPVVLNAEYLESDPLAKTEWIKFIACFYDELDQAGIIFDSISSAYNEYIAIAAKATTKPTILSGLPWKDTWWVPGGSSFAATLIDDAGGEYIWKEDSSREAIPLDTEVVFSKAQNADIWINAGSALSLSDIQSLDSRLQLFEAYRIGNVFNNNARVNELGGNVYWETGVMEPHVILKDLISIFHPEILPDHTLVYYQRLY
ncbi:MAG: ABC transporter substrate-binding protein [Bacteroidales bacterium]|nr:ABC transporter substrate-binding protein [Bacteroidales bacterium]